MAFLSRIALAGIALGATGCSFDRGTGRFEEQIKPDAAMIADVGADAGETRPLDDPEGTWMLFVEDRNCLVGTADDVESIIWSWYLVDVRQPDPGRANLELTTHLCRQTLSPLAFGFLSVVPDGIPDVTPPAQSTAFLVDGEPGAPFYGDTINDYWGIDGVADDEAMPDADDPRFYDQDGDGNPGVTLLVTTRNGGDICQVYAGQRVRVGLEGEVIDRNRIDGVADSGTDKVILATSTDLCASGDVVPNEAPHIFSMVRIDGTGGAPQVDLDGDGDVTCDEFRARIDGVMAAYGIEQAEPDPAMWCR